MAKKASRTDTVGTLKSRHLKTPAPVKMFYIYTPNLAGARAVALHDADTVGEMAAIYRAAGITCEVFEYGGGKVNI